MEDQGNDIKATVQTMAVSNGELRADLASRGREIQDIKAGSQMLEARIITLEKAVAKLDAANGR